MFKRMSSLFLGGCLIMGLAACGDADVEKVEADTNSTSDTGSEPKKEKPTEQSLKIGESVNFDGLIITLNEARIEPGGEFDNPDNDQFLVVNLTAENTTDTEQTVSSVMNVELKDAEGYSYNTTIMLEGVKAQFDGSVEAGGKLRGEIPFDVPNSDEYSLSFSNPFKSGKAIWVIPASELSK